MWSHLEVSHPLGLESEATAWALGECSGVGRGRSPGGSIGEEEGWMPMVLHQLPLFKCMHEK